MKSLTFVTCITLFLSLTCLQSLTEGESFLRSPVGTTIHEDHIRSSLPDHIHTLFSDVEDLSTHVYEVSHSHDTLYGPDNFSLPLNHLEDVRTVRSHPGMNVRVNGKVIYERPDNLRVLSGKGYNVLLHGPESQVVHVWGNGLHLHPVSARYNHVLFNYNMNSDGSVTMRTEVDMNIDEDSEVEAGYESSHPGANQMSEKSQTEQSSTDETTTAQSGSSGDEVFEEVTFTSTRQKEAMTNNLVDIGKKISARQASNGACTMSNRYVVEVSVAFETQFCALSGNQYLPTIGLLQAVFDEANLIFNRDTCVEVALVDVEGYCAPGADPYAFIFNGLSTDFNEYSGLIYSRFRTFFRDNRSSVRRDTAYFFSAYRYNGGFSFGIAGFPGTCQGNAYGLVNGPNSNVFTHEIGHNLNCDHTDEGAPQSRTDFGIMRSSIDGNQLYFASDSVQSITDYVNTDFRTGCLSTAQSTCDDSCPANCVNNKCVAPVNPPAGFVSCKRTAARDYYCTRPNQSSGFTFYQIVDCPAEFVQVPFNATDPEILCCASSTAQLSPAALRSLTRQDRYTVNSVMFNPVLFYSNGVVRQGSNLVTDVSFFSTFSATCSSGTVPQSTPPTPTSTPIPTITSSPSTIPGTTVPPTPTSSASITSSPSRSPIALVVTSFPTPTSSISAPPVMLPSPSSSPVGGSLTCADGLSTNFGFTCRRTGRGFVTIRLFQIGTVNVRLSLRFGTIQVITTARRNRYVRLMTMRLQGGPTDQFTQQGRSRRVRELYSTQMKSLSVPVGETDCCGRGKFSATMSVVVCDSRDRCVRTSEFEIPMNIRCGTVCNRNARKFVPVHMNSSTQCPRCQRI